MDNRTFHALAGLRDALDNYKHGKPGDGSDDELATAAARALETAGFLSERSGR